MHEPFIVLRSSSLPDMLALSNVQAWLAPVFQEPSSLDLGHPQMWFVPAFQKAILVDKPNVKAWLTPLFENATTTDLDHVKAWLALTFAAAPSGITSHVRELARTMIERSSLFLIRLIAHMESAFERSTMGFLLSGILILFIGYKLFLGVHNVFFHPLSKFPGPLLAAASQLPYSRAALRGKHYQWVKALHDYYDSDVVRVSPDELSFISPQAWKDMTGCGAGHRPFEQDERVHGKPPNPDCVSSMLTATLPDHARMRKVLDHAFSSKAFQEQQPVLESYVKKLISSLRKEVDSPSRGRVDLVKWFNWTTFDIVGDFSFGESFNCIENRDNHPWLNTIFGNLKVITFIGISNRFTILRRLLPHLIPKRAKQETKRHFAYLEERITRRMELGADRPDFITPMLKNNNNGKGLTPAEIRANMGLMVVAGSESVVTVTCGAIYYMLKNPATMARLTEEIRSAFPSEADINPQGVLRLNYLTAIINEALRLYPSTPGLPACRVPAEGSMVSGEWVAGNTGVSICQYAAFRSTRNFLDPDAFIPDRWLGDPRFASDRRDVFHPFSKGPRSCIGKAMGDMEVRLILAHMLCTFDLELMEDSGKDWTDQVVYLTWQKNPLMVRLKLASGEGGCGFHCGLV